MKKSFELFWISFLSLFLEIACIRWIPGSVKLMGYYTNTVLISSFLGLGIGCLLAHKKPNLVYLFAPFITLLVLICHFSPFLTTQPLFLLWIYFSILFLTVILLTAAFRKNPMKGIGLFIGISLLLFLGWMLVKRGSLRDTHVLQEWFERGTVIWGGKRLKTPWILLVPFLFLLNAAAFLSVGQVVGRKLAPFQPLMAYAINVLGSLLGVLTMTLFSFLNAPPLLWFGLVFLGISVFLLEERRLLFSSLFLFGVSLFFVSQPQSLSVEFWSPYYKIELEKLPQEKSSFGIVVNHDFYQMAVDLSPEALRRDPGLRPVQLIYDLPYRFNRPESALILGSGTGNDVAGALRNGLKRITAVEIDPTILELGRTYHPESPYGHPAVRTVVTDARAFLKSGRERYDLISFGTLDSHSLFSGMGSVRLDSYVYTLESLREARDRLSEKGLLIITFNVARPWIGTKLYRMMETTFGHPPLVLHPKGENHQLFIVGNREFQLPRSLRRELVQEDYSGEGGVTLPTDDWPHLYIRTKSLSNEYISVIFLLSFFSILSTGYLVGKSAVFQPTFFFLGAAFLLLETKGITHLSLLFGSTWIVNCAVISAILLTALLASCLVARLKPKRVSRMFLGLFAALLLNYQINPASFLVENPVARTLIACLFIALPIFFAGMIFTTLFSRAKDPAAALGSNLIGSVVGGLTEYASLLLGSRSVYLLALFFYLIAMVSHRRGTT